MAITVAMRTSVSQLYVALFGRAPDGEGLAFWTGELNAGKTMTQIANAMYAVEPARAYYPGFLTNGEIIASFYVNVLGRTGDAEGLAYWTAKLNAAGATPGSVITEMIGVVAAYNGTDPAGLKSKALFNNKVEVAQWYGEHNGTIDGAATILTTITDNHATVDAAIATIAESGDILTLTTGQDTVVAGILNDTIRGTFGNVGNTGDTYSVGDIIDGTGGTDTLDLTVAVSGGSSSPAATVKNVEKITITDVFGGTFNAALVENAPSISFTDTLAGNTSMVTNGALASVMGLQGKGNLTVDYAGTSGTADTASLSLTAVGTSTSARSTVTVSDGNTIEAVNVASTGSNFVTLVGGTAAKALTVTGAGTNDFDLTSATALAAVSTIDASAATGANTFRVGANLNTTDVVKGGTGADTLNTNFTLAALIKPTVTGVETLTADFDASAIVDLSATTGLTTINLAGSSADQTFTKAAATVATINITGQADGDNDLNFSRATDVEAPLAIKLGSTATGSAAFNMDVWDLSGTSSLAVSTVAAFAHSITGGIDVAGDQSALSFTVANSSTLLVQDGGTVVDGDIDALSFTVGTNALYSGGVYTEGDIGPVAVTVAAGGEAYNFVNASGGNIGNVTMSATGNETDMVMDLEAEGGDIGDISVTVAGDDSWVSGYFQASGGDVGNVSISLTGDNVSGQFVIYAASQIDSDYDYVEGGNIGNITMSVDGDEASGYLNVIASGGSIGNISLSADNGAKLGAWISGNSHPTSSGGLDTSGDIGNVTIFVGEDANVSGNVTASGGDIGDISVSLVGSHASGGFEFNASATVDGDWTSDDYAHGGNVGNVSLDINGDDANYYMTVLASGGDVGDVSLSVEGTGASGYLYVTAERYLSGSTGGDIGTVSVTLGDDTSFELGMSFDGETGAITVTGGDNVSGGINVSGGSSYIDSGTAQLGAMAVDLGDDADFHVRVSGFSGSTSAITATFGDDATVDLDFWNLDGGDVGNVMVTAGANAYVDLNAVAVDGDIGDYSVTVGTSSDIEFDVFWGGPDSIGTVTYIGGDASSTATVSVTDTTNSMGGVAATAWLGSLDVNLSGVTIGTTIQVGAGGSDVDGAEGADNVFLGAGVDTFHFDATPTSVDTLFSFTAGAGKDKLDVENSADFAGNTHTINEADTLASGDVAKLTDIAGGQDITTAAGLLAALNAGGEYALVDATPGAGTYTFITAASASATTYYVFNAVETADAEFDSVTLVGVVNASSAFSALVAANVI